MLTTQEDIELSQSAPDLSQPEAAEHPENLRASRIARLKAEIEPLAISTRLSPSQLDKLDSLQDELKAAESGLEIEGESAEGDVPDGPEPSIPPEIQTASPLAPVIKSPVVRTRRSNVEVKAGKAAVGGKIVHPSTPSFPDGAFIVLLDLKTGKFKIVPEEDKQSQAAAVITEPTLGMARAEMLKPRIEF